MYTLLFALFVSLLPITTYAQTTGSLQGLITGIGGFLGAVVIPLLLGIAFLALVWNTVRFFIIGAANEESQQNAKTLAFYSVAAFVLILSFWGIVRMLGDGIGLSVIPPCEDMRSDYYKITTSAPCSSPRPEPRPPTPTPGNDPLYPIPPGTDPTPNTFTPTGEPIAYLPVIAAQDAIRAKTQQSLSTVITAADYGAANVPIITDALFDDFTTVRSTLVTEQERMKSAYRLLELGVITQGEFDTYLSATNKYFTDLGYQTGTIEESEYINIAVPLPSSVVSAVTNNQNAVAGALYEYNYNIDFGTRIDVPATLDELYNKGTYTTTERYDAMTDLFYGPNPVLDLDAGADMALSNDFTDNINTERIFGGIFETF